ncbi:MAG: hypothetical protein K2X82_22775 [Gemmataceae bacterium]|nr:hypothetical protein [Gemmataceae bacterium]
MRREDIRAYTRAVPFLPFRLYLTTGETFDVLHPDMIVTTLGTAHIAVPPPGGPLDVADRVVVVSLIHVQKGEYLVPPAAPSATGSNGTP